MERWLKDETRPALSMLPVFRSALSGLIDKLDEHHRKWGFGETIADEIEEGEEPEYLAPAVSPNEADKVRRWLSAKLEKPQKTFNLFKDAEDVEFSRAQLYRAASQLKVVKEHKGAGRGSYSIWRLP